VKNPDVKNLMRGAYYQDADYLFLLFDAFAVLGLG